MTGIDEAGLKTCVMTAFCHNVGEQCHVEGVEEMTAPIKAAVICQPGYTSKKEDVWPWQDVGQLQTQSMFLGQKTNIKCVF